MEAVHEQALDLFLGTRVVAQLRQGANAQLNDLVFDAGVKVELMGQSGEGFFRRGELLRRS